MNRKIINYIKVIWFIGLLSILISGLYDEKKFYDGEAVILHYLQVMYLTAPLGYLFALIGGFALDYLQWLQNVHQDFIASWLLMVAGGYIQWFIFIPIIIRKIGNKRGSHHKKNKTYTDSNDKKND
ncbi:MAG: hypothetical protein H7A09_09485 [Oceanospirillaceae bacterium]|nr:hypothetical protein [Oceanospirillaceae bacterium]MCP5335343.1 hypothetical protein [Oceanospirillaceae bacterium]MCP5350704.1 hypothetical protein [Oceanospirillaceae bacterium]